MSIKEKVESGEAFEGEFIACEDSTLRFLTEEGIEELPIEWLKEDERRTLLDVLKPGKKYYVHEDFSNMYTINIYPNDKNAKDTIARVRIPRGAKKDRNE